MQRKLRNALEDRQAVLREQARVSDAQRRELASLAQTKGWLYAQHVANSICSEFECKPGDDKWEIYTTIQYAYQRLFGEVKKFSGPKLREFIDAPAPKSLSITEQIQAEIKKKYGSGRDDSETGSGTTSGGGRKRGSRKTS